MQTEETDLRIGTTDRTSEPLHCVCIRDLERHNFMEFNGIPRADWERVEQGENYILYHNNSPLNQDDQYMLPLLSPDGCTGGSAFISADEFKSHFLVGTETDYNARQKARYQHDLKSITHTKGGRKLKTGELSYSVYRDGGWAGITGDAYCRGAYRDTRWTDEGTCTNRDASYDLPFAPERPPVTEEEVDVRTQRHHYFGAAIQALNNGKRIARVGWTQYWVLSGLTAFVPQGQLQDEGQVTATSTGEPLVIAVEDDGTFTLAQAMQADWLATDWLVLD